MRICCSPYAITQVARRRQTVSGPCFQLLRPFTSTVSTPYPSLVTNIPSDVQSYKIQAQPNSRAKNVAVVGGGITGLAAAYNLTKALPNAKVTLFEAKKKLGGWLDSELLSVEDGKVLFEWGPRTIRYDGAGAARYTAELVGTSEQSSQL